MEDEFADVSKKLVSPREFRRLAKYSLVEILGDSLASRALEYMGGEIPQNPQVFKRELKEVLGTSADKVLDYMVSELRSRELKNISRGRFGEVE